MLYPLYVNRSQLLCKKGLIVTTEQQMAELQRSNRLLIKTVSISAAIAIVPGDEKNPQDKAYPKKEITQTRNSKGEVICEYYYNPDLYKRIVFTESADDKMPVTVITNQAYYDGRDIFQTVESMLYALIVSDLIVATLICLRRAYKIKKRA